MIIILQFQVLKKRLKKSLGCYEKITIPTEWAVQNVQIMQKNIRPFSSRQERYIGRNKSPAFLPVP